MRCTTKYLSELIDDIRPSPLEHHWIMMDLVLSSRGSKDQLLSPVCNRWTLRMHCIDSIADIPEYCKHLLLIEELPFSGEIVHDIDQHVVTVVQEQEAFFASCSRCVLERMRVESHNVGMAPQLRHNVDFLLHKIEDLPVPYDHMLQCIRSSCCCTFVNHRETPLGYCFLHLHLRAANIYKPAFKAARFLR